MSKSISVPNIFIKKDLDNNNNVIVTCLGFSKQIRSKINELAKNIIKLDLSCCKINGTNLIELGEILENCKVLESLKLNLNSINIDEAIDIVTVITNCSNLKELDLSNNNIILDKNSDKTILLINNLKECTSLVNLNLSCNSIAKENIMEFEKNLPDCIVNWTYY
jgi:Ran GTPase-activating protein (RanGAP) involved in mRNA processing and transport